MRQAAAKVDAAEEPIHDRLEEEAREAVGVALASAVAAGTDAPRKSRVVSSASEKAPPIRNADDRAVGEAKISPAGRRGHAAGVEDHEAIHPGDDAADIPLELIAEPLLVAATDLLAAAAGSASDWPGSRIHGEAPRSRGSRVNPPARAPSASVDVTSNSPLHLRLTIPPSTTSHTTRECPWVGVEWPTAAGREEVCVARARLMGGAGGASVSSVRLVRVSSQTCAQSSGSDGFSTASMSRLTQALWPCKPSRSTIAPPARQQAADAAMRAIASRGVMDDEHTQHRPRLAAWTGAPGHTRTAAPPGRPTNPHWMAAPVGRALGHEDENRDACATKPVVSVLQVIVSGRAHGVIVPGVSHGGAAEVCALKGNAPPITSFPSSHPPTTPPPKLLTPFSLPFQHSPSLVSSTEASANLAGSKTHDARVTECGASVCVSVKPVAKGNADTHTVASMLLRPYAATAYSLLLAVGHILANDAHRSTGALTNHEGSSNFWASTAAMLLWAVQPPPQLLRAPGDWSAGIHDGVTGSTEFNAWRTTARAALLIPVVTPLVSSWMQRTRLPVGMGAAGAKQYLAMAGSCTIGAGGSVVGAAVRTHGARRAEAHVECTRRDQAGLQEVDNTGDGAMQRTEGARSPAPRARAGCGAPARGHVVSSTAVPRVDTQPPMPQAVRHRGGTILPLWR